MSGVKVVLDGTVVPSRNVEGEAGIKVTITTKRTRTGGGPMKRQPTKLTFYGEQWELIRDQLQVPADGKNRKVPIQVYDVCPGLPDFLLFDGVVRATGSSGATASALSTRTARRRLRRAR